MNHKIKKVDNTIEVTVTLPVLDVSDRVYKVFPTQVLKLVESKYNIVSYLKNPVIEASYKEEITAIFSFLIEEKQKTNARKTRQKDPKPLEQDIKKQKDKQEG